MPIRREVGPESRDTKAGQEVSVLAKQGVDAVPRVVRGVGLVEEHDPVIDPKEGPKDQLSEHGVKGGADVEKYDGE